MQMCLLFLDVAVGKSSAHFSCNQQPLAALMGVTVSGTLSTGRQITAPPVGESRRLQVGASHSVPVPVALKGARALIKVYTDLKAAVDEPRVCYSMGLEPTIALVRLMTHRLTHCSAELYSVWVVLMGDCVRIWRGSKAD